MSVREGRIHEGEQRMEARVFGARVRWLRDAKGWTQGQLAYKAQTTPAQISRIENDERPGVQAVTISRIAQALDTTVEYLMGQTGNSERPVPDPAVDPGDPSEAALRAKAEELVRRWRMVDQFAPDQLAALVSIAFTQAELVLGAARADEKADEENREEVNEERE